MAEHATYKPLIEDAERLIRTCTDYDAGRAFRAYVATWFKGFQEYISAMERDQSLSSETPWADLWHAGADAKGMPEDLWRFEGGTWLCSFVWPDPFSGKEIHFELRSRGAGKTPFVSAPEFALLNQALPRNIDSAVTSLVRIRERFPGAVLESANGVELVPGFLR